MRIAVIIALILAGLFLMLVCYAVVTGNAPEDEARRKLEDDEQEAYLREWRKQKEERSARKRKP